MSALLIYTLLIMSVILRLGATHAIQLYLCTDFLEGTTRVIIRSALPGGGGRGRVLIWGGC